MKLHNEFEVAAPIDEVWPALLDIPRVARLLPGASIEPTDEAGVYTGSMKVKLGPMVVTYKGTARLGEVDTEQHVAPIEVEAREARGQGRAQATISNRLVDEGGRTRVIAETELRITGRQAQFGRGVMQDVATSMLDEFARRFEESLRSNGEPPAAPAGAGAEQPTADGTENGAAVRTPPPEPEALDVGSLVAGTRAARQGAALAAAAAALGLLLARALRRRRRARRGAGA